MRYIIGEDRCQFHIMNYDEEVGKTHIVRVVDAFVDRLDLKKYNFTYSISSKTGRKSYNPKSMLKLYIYGYIDGVRTSRKLEKALNESIPYRWLMHDLRPNFKTIADFRKDNIMNIRSVFLEFNKLCLYANLIDFELVAIDGTYIEAVNHNQNNYTEKKIKTILKRIKNKFDKEHQKLYPNDKLNEIKINDDELTKLKEDEAFYNGLLKKMKDEGITQISLTDPDSRMMQKQGSKRDVCFNVQISSDSKNGLIVETEVCNEGSDSRQLYPLAKKTKDTYALPEVKVTADKGYGFGKEINKCNDDNIQTYVPIPKTSSDSRYGKKWKTSNFIYDSETDSVICPNGNKLTLSYIRKSKESKEYRNRKACKNCPDRKECTNNNKCGYRTISRSFYADVVVKQQAINAKSMDILKRRKSIVEHPFGTIKKSMNQGSFLTKGLKSVNGEFTYSALAYNIKRVYNILGFDKMMALINNYFRSSTPKNCYFYKLFENLLYFHPIKANNSLKMAS